ncbi:MAG: penicillin-binding protein 2 [Peptococcaceae bacterium]|nr:penicillin-binding protein 2 [Peptococcaceae bacterium]
MEYLRQKRLVNIFFLFLLCMLGLAGRFWYLQIEQGAMYANLALEQTSSWVPLEETARGDILDRNLRPLTGTKEENRVIIFPSAVVEREDVARDLAAILEIDPVLAASYFQGDAVTLPYKLTAAQVATINNKAWTGVIVMPVRCRYQEHQPAAQIIGHLGKISSWQEFSELTAQTEKQYRFSDLVGKAGLEKYYEEVLKGSWPEKSVRVFADARGNLLGGPDFVVEQAAAGTDSKNLVLTIDIRIQEIVEKVMDNQVKKGAVVVMEAGSGEILAMAGRPSFDPSFSGEDDLSSGDSIYFDHCTALYQPGSVFKIAVAAAALEEGLVDLNTVFSCTGEKDRLVPCWNKAGHGKITFEQAFAHSCNPVFARLGMELGAAKMIEYTRLLGLDNQFIVGYPVPVDARQDLKKLAEPFNLAGCSVGQGPLLVTPVQIAAMTNTLLTGGLYQAPSLVKEIRDNSGNSEQLGKPEAVRALSPGTAQALRSLLEEATRYGTGQAAMLTPWGSAGKTGSAQLVNDGELVNAWFTGYAPLSQPRYVVTVLVENGESGSVSAAPVFKEIMEHILQLPTDAAGVH